MKPAPIVIQLELGNMANYSYILGDPETKTAAVIDPNSNITQIDAAAAAAGLTITTVLLTHGHYDHVGGVGHYDQKGLPVWLCVNEMMLYVPHCLNLKRFPANHELTIGKLSVLCMPAPGHTPGGICFLAEGNLFTGDTLFVDGVGRTDLPGGNATILFNTLQKLKNLPPETIVWPGHNYGSVPNATMGTLAINNPYLACPTEKELLKLF